MSLIILSPTLTWLSGPLHRHGTALCTETFKNDYRVYKAPVTFWRSTHCVLICPGVTADSKWKAMVNQRTIRHSCWCAAVRQQRPVTSSALAPYCAHTEEQLPKPQRFLSTPSPRAPAAQSPHSAPARAASCFYSVHSSPAWSAAYIPEAVAEGIFNNFKLVENGHCRSGAHRACTTFCCVCLAPASLRSDSSPADVRGGCGDGVVHLDLLAALRPLLWQASTRCCYFTSLLLPPPLWICWSFDTSYFYHKLSKSGFSHESKHSFQFENTTPAAISNCCKVQNRPSSSWNKREKKDTKKCKTHT